MNLTHPDTFATSRQDLLLRAAVGQGPEAVAAWHAWRRTADLDSDLDHGSFRLLPLLYLNLRQLGVTDPEMARLRGVYRQAWSRNQTLFHDLAQMVDHLQRAGVRTMLLKGAPLALLYHQGLGARPMADIDLLVPHDQARPAYDLLHAAGCVACEALDEPFMRYHRSVHLVTPAARELDLHWRLLDGFIPDDEPELWAGGVPLQIAGVAALAPSPTDLLFHTVVHGVAWNPEPPIRWVADAATLAQSPAAAIDWQRLAVLAARHRVGLRLRKGLEYLRAVVPAAVPPAAMQALERVPATWLEQREYRFLTMPRGGPRKAHLGDGLAYHVSTYRRLTGWGRRRVPGGFAGYLNWLMQADSAAELAWRLGRVGVLLAAYRLPGRQARQTQP